MPRRKRVSKNRTASIDPFYVGIGASPRAIARAFDTDEERAAFMRAWQRWSTSLPGLAYRRQALPGWEGDWARLVNLVTGQRLLTSRSKSAVVRALYEEHESAIEEMLAGVIAEPPPVLNDPDDREAIEAVLRARALSDAAVLSQ